MSEALVEVVRFAVPCDTGAPGLVRDQFERIKELAPVRSEATLVASELVSNAVRHSGCGQSHAIDVRVRLGPGLCEIAVHDPGVSGGLPEAQENTDVGGLGLAIVDTIARRWGTERSDGQVVWAHLSIPPPP